MNASRLLSTSALILSFATFLWWPLQLKSNPRKPASITTSELSSALQDFQRKTESPQFGLRTCTGILQTAFRELDSYSYDNFSNQNIQQNAQMLLYQTFHVRLALRKVMTRMMERGVLSQAESAQQQDCVQAFRRAYRGLRVLEDYIGEAAVGFPFDQANFRGGVAGPGSASAPNANNVMPAFQGGHNYLLWNPDFEMPGTAYVPQSGDVILSRGTASTSAAIARISDEQTNFSHLSIVHVDERTKEIQTIEAHIEVGSDVFDWATYVGDKKIRAAVFRFADPVKAHLAAVKIKERVENYKRQNMGKLIRYDFSMNMNDADDIFCSEIVRIAFQDAGVPGVPLFPSTINPRNRSFVDAIGVTERVTFAPADIELDHRFTLVAEWRDHRRLHTSHYMDAVLMAMYSWMEVYNYHLIPSAEHSLKAFLGFTLRRIPLLDRTVAGQFPLNMKKETIETVQVLNTTVNQLTTYLEAQEKSLPGTGPASPKRLSPSQMREKLEQFRRQDEARYLSSPIDPSAPPQNMPPHHFHPFFRKK